MSESVELEASGDIEALVTLMEAKHGTDYEAADAIAQAVAYWLENHEVAEIDDDTNHRSIIPTPETAIKDGEIRVDGPSPFDGSADEPIGEFPGDGTIPKR